MGMMKAGAWTEVRAFSNTAADASPILYSTVSGWTFVRLPEGACKTIEVRASFNSESDDITTSSTGGTITSVTFAVWRKAGDAAGTTKYDKVGTFTCAISSNLAVATPPAVFDNFNAGQVYVSVESIAGGTGTIVVASGSVHARAVA